MTIETPPVGLTSHHTEQTLKARHQEALDIFHAWLERHKVSGGKDRAAVEIQMEEAWVYVERTAADLQLYREVVCPRGAMAGRSVAHGRSGVIPYARHR
ncbi:hypothetical protein HYQ00_gp64 [Arthrobacter phage TripleJ]|uniref:Uncharacterized protein n=1 Tax=Arthrobacter phage TripleJ TaxID=2599838 RepID=A0A5J6TGX5_9CAUD|nr:hypothetical protein HYQ00_gp64 [Arthrobacter phage TripleJ]QFG09608.1 hypothetical protein PBI_TRIPLEJ_64 [Arthrobacter phage TripleJ]